MTQLNRRHFMAASAVGGLAALTTTQRLSAQAQGSARDYYELRQYILATEEQRKGMDAFLSRVAIPALHRVGVAPAGVFCPLEDPSPLYVLLRHRSLESMATLVQRLGSDPEFMNQGRDFLDAPADRPAYQRLESSLLVAFQGMPELDIPTRSPGRILQLRIYESPSVKTGQKKIEMFNEAGEIRIFREAGLHPVFFGETLVGAKMPNLTYMLAFDSQEELKANWKRFGSHPDWRKLRTMPEYADKRILSNITNILLKPAPYSEI